jgi:CPA1 family monovalent cation:H+ antiporter
VLYALILEFALDNSVTVTAETAVSKFLITFFGGLLVGAAVGGIGALGLRLVTGRVLQGVVSLISAYAAFLAGDELLDVSGVMAVLAAGLAIGWACRNVKGAKGNTFIDELWEFNAYIANATIFLLVGITITVEMFREQWLAMLIGIGAVLVARAVGIFGVMAPVSRLPGIGRVSFGYQAVMYWGGVRGAVALALALSLPLELGYWYSVQSIAYGVVLFTLFVQAPTMPILLRVVKL